MADGSKKFQSTPTLTTRESTVRAIEGTEEVGEGQGEREREKERKRGRQAGRGCSLELP